MRWICLVFGIHGLLAQACALTLYRWQVGKVEVRKVALPLTSRWQLNQTGLQILHRWHGVLRRGRRVTLKCAKSYDHLNLETDTSSGTKQALSKGLWRTSIPWDFVGSLLSSLSPQTPIRERLAVSEMNSLTPANWKTRSFEREIKRAKAHFNSLDNFSKIVNRGKSMRTRATSIEKKHLVP